MSADAKSSVAGKIPRQRAKPLRIAGGIVLLTGGIAAGLVYWIGMRSQSLEDDPSMLGFNRAEHRQMGQLFGGMGNLIADWSDDLKQPDTQAILIVIVSILVAAGLFYIARLIKMDDNPQPNADRNSNSA